MKSLLLLGAISAFSFACSGGYGTEGADGAPAFEALPQNVARAAETPAPAATEQPAATERTEEPAQPTPVPATAPTPGNQPADAGPAPVASDPPSPAPSAGDAGPAPAAPPRGLWAPCELEAECTPYGLMCASSPTHPSTATAEGWVCRPVPALQGQACTVDDGCASGLCYPQSGYCSRPLPLRIGDHCDDESECGGLHCDLVQYPNGATIQACCAGADPTCPRRTRQRSHDCARAR